MSEEDKQRMKKERRRLLQNGYARAYYKRNREIVLNRENEKRKISKAIFVMCDACSCIINKNSIWMHNRTQKHINAIQGVE